jgi:hypothetical protein
LQLAIKGIRGPPRQLMKNSLEDGFIRDRMRGIQTFLTELQNVPNIEKNPKFADFFQISAIEEQKV